MLTHLRKKMSITKNSSNHIIRTIGFLFIITILIGLSSCNIPGFPLSTPEPPPLVPEGEQDIPEAQVPFYVKIPTDTPVEEPIVLSVLDEVTGLALNSKRFSMEKIDESHYSVTLSFRLGSIIKYRYSRQGDILAEEHITDGRPVRYRLFHVTKPGEVQDMVARWNDTIYTGPTGRITGKITNPDKTPQAGVLVAAGGAQTFSAGDGSFLIEGLPPGTHNLVAYALDGKSEIFQQGALVAEGSNTPAEIQVNPIPMVDITFLVHAPEGTVPIVPLRIAGNLLQLGNTFSDLAGGVNTLATRMPVLASLSDNTYGIILSLPVGADMRE